MDKIQKVLIKAGHKDLAEEYYNKIAARQSVSKPKKGEYVIYSGMRPTGYLGKVKGAKDEWILVGKAYAESWPKKDVNKMMKKFESKDWRKLKTELF